MGDCLSPGDITKLQRRDEVIPHRKRPSDANEIEGGNAKDTGILGEPFPVLYIRHQCPLDGM